MTDFQYDLTIIRILDVAYFFWATLYMHAQVYVIHHLSLQPAHRR